MDNNTFIIRSYDERSRLVGDHRGSARSLGNTTYTIIDDLSGGPRHGYLGHDSLIHSGCTPAGRKVSRIRTNSVSIMNDAGDDIISTSYGPVVLQDALRGSRDWILGWFLAIISGVLFTANNFFVKYLNMSALEMLLVRSTMQSIVVVIALVWTKTHFLPASNKDRVLVILQGLLSGARIFMQFACLAFMPLGDALTLVFTEPLWTIILSRIILKIPIGWWKSIFGLFLVSGMVLSIQPPFIFSQPSISNHTVTSSTEAPFSSTQSLLNVTEAPFSTTQSSLNGTEAPFSTTLSSQYRTKEVYFNNARAEALIDLMPKRFKVQNGTDLSMISVLANMTGVTGMIKSYNEERDSDSDGYGSTYYLGVILALGCALSGSLANVIISKCENVSSSVMVLYSGLGGVIVALGCSFMDDDNRIVFNITAIPWDEWLILLILGSSGLIGYYAMTRSLQLIPPTTVAVLRAMEIILAYIAQVVVMGEIPNALAISGSSIVMVCVIGFAMEETILGCYNCY